MRAYVGHGSYPAWETERAGAFRSLPLLNAKGLRSTMPTAWNGKSLFARYDAAGITTCNVSA